MKVLAPGTAPEIRVLGDVVRILHSSDDCCIVEIESPPGGGVPPHTHTLEDEVFYVLEGEYEFFVDGEVKIAGPGTLAHLPPHKPHGFKSLEHGRVLVTVYPGKMERMFHDLSLAQPDEVADICGRYGITFMQQA